MAAALALTVLALVLGAPPVLAQAQAADMAVTVLTMSGGGIVAGGTTNLNLVFQNRGPGNAQGARATVTFNKPVTLSVTSTNPQANCSTGGGTLTCAVGSLGDGQRVTVQAVVRLSSSATGSLTATARANSDANDPNDGNDQLQSTLPISAEADLTIGQSITPNPPQAGGNATVRPTATNRGPSNAQNVVLTVNIPAGVSLVSASGSCSAAGARLTCNLGTLAAGASGGVQVTYGLAGIPAGSQLTASASVKSGTRETNNGNNTISQGFSIAAASADIAIAKIAAPNPVGVGANVTFTVVVTNGGPSDARGVVVTDPLPAGLRVRSTQSPGNCTPVGLTVICNIGTVGAGASATVVITAQVLASARPGPIVNRVSVSSDTADRNPGNNAASVSVRIITSATTARPPGTARPRPTALPETEQTTTTLPGELPPTGAAGLPFGVAALLIGISALLWAVSYRLRGVTDSDAE